MIKARIALPSYQRAVGSSLESILKLNVYVTSVDMFPAVIAVYRRYFPESPPARIFINVPLGMAGLILKWIVLPPFYKTVLVGSLSPFVGERPRRCLVRRPGAPFRIAHNLTQDDSLAAYGWLGIPNSTHFAPDRGSVSTSLCRVKACQELWSNKGPRTVSEGH